MENAKFRGMSKNLDNNRMVYGYGCYTDQNEREFVIVDEPVPMTFIQVEKIEVRENI